MTLVKEFLRNCSRFFFILLGFFLFANFAFARVENIPPSSFSDCGSDGLSCTNLIIGPDLGLISLNDDNEYTSSIWPDSLFAFSDETAWNNDDNPYLMQFNFVPSISGHIVEADFVFDGIFSPSVCTSFTDCRFKLLSSVDSFSSSVKLYEQSDLIITSSPLINEIPSSQLGNLNSLSVKLLAYGTPPEGSAGVQSLIDQAGLNVYIDDILPTVDGVVWKKNGSVIPQAGTATDPAYVSDLSSMTFDLTVSDTGDAISGLDKEVFVIYQEHPSKPGTPYWNGQGGLAYCSWGGTENSEALNGGASQTVLGIELSRCSTQVLPAGRYVVANHLYDIAGNLRGGTLLTFVFDSAPPDAPDLLSPSNNAIIRGDILLSDWTDVVDADHYIYESYHDAGASNLRYHHEYDDSQKSAFNVADSEFWWRVKAVDLAGNESDWSDLWHVTIDNTAPVVGITNPLDGNKVKDTVNIRGFITDENLSHYNIAVYPGGVDVSNFSLRLEQDTVYGSEFTEKSLYSWNTSGYADGEYQIRLAARDLAGNRELGGDSEQVITVIVDNTHPIITFDQPLTATVHSGIVHLQASCNEECDYVNFWWKIEGDNYVSADKKYHYVRDNGTLFEWDLNTLNALKADGSYYTLVDGTYYLYGAGKDVAGNWARTSEISIIVDNTNPTVDITSPLDGSVISGTTTVTVDATDLTSGVERVELSYRAVGDATWIPLDTLFVSPYTYDWNTTGYPLGDYELQAEAFDLAGNSEVDQIEVGVAAVISGETGSTPYFGQIYVSWSTDRPTTAQVVYDTVPHLSADPSLFNYGYAYTTGVFDLGKTTFHETLLTGLNNGTTYYYRFISAGSPTAVSGEMSNRTFSSSGPGSPPSSGPSGGGTPSPLVAYVSPSVMGVYTTPASVLPEEGEILGEETTPTPEPEKSPPSITTPTPRVLGAFTSVSPLYFLGGGLLISLILMLLLFRRE